MQYIDLHVHSTASDGSLTPTEVVAAAHDAGLRYFALTDHDTVDGIEEALTAAKAYEDLDVIPGIELSCYQDNTELHIVGLFVDHKNETFVKGIKQLEIDRKTRNQQIIQKFVDAGIPMTLEELQEGNPKRVITRAHFAELLIKKGICKDKADVFDHYLGIGCPFYLPKPKVTPEHVINLIKLAGGVAILAHPYSYKLTKSEVETLLDKLIPAGLAGMECYYSTYDDGETQELRSIALQKNLLVSGGSDFHGTPKPDISIGTGHGSLRVPEKLLTLIKEYRKC